MLQRILEQKRREVEQLVLPPEVDVERRSLKDALRKARRPVGLIAEVKKASPSRGVFRDSFDPVELALSYERVCANAISVLTDETFFLGHRRHLTAIKQAVKLPVLRKDFIISFKQIEESARIGADAVLLIAGAVEPQKLHEMYLAAQEKGLECLVEVHGEEQLETILAHFVPEIIGVNNRDLKTFRTSLTVTEQCCRLIPESSTFVSESGIFSQKDIARVAACGAHGVLVGEALVRASTVDASIKQLFGGETSAETENQVLREP